MYCNINGTIAIYCNEIGTVALLSLLRFSTKARHVLHHGFPVKGSFSCLRRDTVGCNLYNSNHPSCQTTNGDALWVKIALDVQKSFAIAFPHWAYVFTFGLHLNPVGCVMREVQGKVKHCLINDGSSLLVLSPQDTGAINSQLSWEDNVQVPPVHYGSALSRIWTRIYALLCEACPYKDIIVYTDGIVSAFWQVQYHPDAAAAYAWRLPASIFSSTSHSIMPSSVTAGGEPHINILEFIAIIINVYLCIIALSSKPFFVSKGFSFLSGVLIQCLADNTSAVSWMTFASCSPSVPICLFLVTLVFHANSLFPHQLTGHYAEGKLNSLADALSWPQEYPSYNNMVFIAYPALQNLRLCQIPQRPWPLHW
jgi:hypothetical protein